MEQIHNEWQQVLENLAVNERKQKEQSETIRLIEEDLGKEKELAQQYEAEIELQQSNLLDVTERLEKFEGKKNSYLKNAPSMQTKIKKNLLSN